MPPAIQSEPSVLGKNQLMIEVTISTHSPTMKKLPHALKSRLLNTA